MLCSNCQRPLPDSLVCDDCFPDEEELTLAPLEGDVTSVSPISGYDSESTFEVESSEIHVEPETGPEPVICKKCQAVIPKGRLQCPQCGYNPQLGRSFDSIELDEYGGAMGFQRFLMKHTSQNDPASLILWLRIFGLFIVSVYIVTSRDFMSLFLSGICISGYLFYLRTAGKPVRFHAGQSVIPKLILLVNRLGGWSGVADTPQASGAVMTYRGQPFNDQNLASIEGTLAVEVLDIPGSTITDTGILYLQNFTNLKALVVQGCAVSENALDELQRCNKILMIWR